MRTNALDARAGGGHKDDRRDWDHEQGGTKKNRWGAGEVEAAAGRGRGAGVEAGARAGARPPRLELELRPAKLRQQRGRRPGPSARRRRAAGRVGRRFSRLCRAGFRHAEDVTDHVWNVALLAVITDARRKDARHAVCRP